jgi:hypothetical protein
MVRLKFQDLSVTGYRLGKLGKPLADRTQKKPGLGMRRRFLDNVRIKPFRRLKMSALVASVGPNKKAF